MELTHQPSANGRIYIICGGTRGDQQPMVTLGDLMKRKGYDICMCIGPESKAWTAEHGFEYLELASFKDTMQNTPGIREACETGDYVKLNKEVAPALAKTLPAEVTEIYSRVKADKDAVAMICTSTHFMLCEPFARKLGIYCASLFFAPFCPTAEYPPYSVDTRNPSTWQIFPGLEDKEEYPTEMNRDLWVGLSDFWSLNFQPLLELSASICEATEILPKEAPDQIELLSNQIMCVDADPAKPMTSRTTDVFYPYSDLLVGAGGPKDYTPAQRARQTGYIFDRSGAGALSGFGEDLEAFLAKGDNPVFFGWGSMVRENNSDSVRAAVGACAKLGKRGVINSGWAGLSLEMLDAAQDAELLAYAEENIFVAETCSHLKLFPRCCCLVTHGGSGTLASMMLSGTPCIVTPAWWDQVFMAERAEAMGIGKRGPHFAKSTAEDLAGLIQEVTTTPSIVEAAVQVAKDLAAQPPGEEVLAKVLEESIKKAKAAKAA